MKRGVYQLLIKLDRDKTIPVGKLGVFDFPRGYYIYTGSAMGGLEARVARHLSNVKRFHWHIDYLLEQSEIIRYAIKECSADGPREECAVHAATLEMDGATELIKGFGSSDCRCRSHLTYFAKEPALALDDTPA